MDKIAHAFQTVIAAMQQNLEFALVFVGILWVINALNAILGYRLNALGIFPRTPYGLVGICFFAFLHGNASHLFFNSIPLCMLADLILLKGHQTFYIVTIAIIILSGIGIWIFGRRAIHIGASSLLMGYFGYLLANAYFHLDATTIILAGVCLYYFGGLVLALFPSVEKNVSWEGHVFGFAAGIATSYYYPIVTYILAGRIPKFLP
jgi:membrane associated rhomboid family serine protease